MGEAQHRAHGRRCRRRDFNFIGPYSKGYNVGYSKGYAKAITDRPTYGTVGTVVNTPADEFKWIGAKLNIWKVKLQLGL